MTRRLEDGPAAVTCAMANNRPERKMRTRSGIAATSQLLHLGRVLTACLLSLTAGCGSASSYHGDGELLVLHRFPALAVKVSFAEFSMDKPMTVTYSIAGLPRLNYDYVVGLSMLDVPSDSGSWPPKTLRELRGSLRIELRDSGVAKRELIGGLNELYWMQLKGDYPLGIISSGPDRTAAFFEQGGGSSAGFDELSVSYAPPATPSKHRARIVIMSDIRRW